MRRGMFIKHFFLFMASLKKVSSQELPKKTSEKKIQKNGRTCFGVSLFLFQTWKFKFHRKVEYLGFEETFFTTFSRKAEKPIAFELSRIEDTRVSRRTIENVSAKRRAFARATGGRDFSEMPRRKSLPWKTNEARALLKSTAAGRSRRINYRSVV